MATNLDGASPQAQSSAFEVLRGHKLAKSYGGHLVLKHVDFSIDRGEIIAVIGENGAGKSTFGKIVSGVVQPESGQIYMAGREGSNQSPRDALRHDIASIPATRA